MGIFTKLLRDTATDLAYKIGMWGPLCLTYVIGMDLAESLSKQYKLNKFYFQFAWTTLHYFWAFLWIFFIIRTDTRMRRKYQMLKSRKC